MRMSGLLGTLLHGEDVTKHPDNSISEFILRELLAFDIKVKEEIYCPPDSQWKTSEEFVKDIDKLITTFSILRSNEDNFKIYDDLEVQRGLLLFIRMYRYLSFLELPENTNGQEA